MAEGKLDNQHLYNDKELIEETDLGWYDYGFRHYDPQIGRFPQLDPLTFEYPFLTPYQYASCDPITNIDIDGLEGGSAVGAIAGKSLANITIRYIKPAAAVHNSFSAARLAINLSANVLNGFQAVESVGQFRGAAERAAQMELSRNFIAPLSNGGTGEIRQAVAEYHENRSYRRPSDYDDTYMLNRIRRDRIQKVNNRASNGVPFVGNMLNAGGHALNGDWGEARGAFSGLGVETAASLVPITKLGPLVARGGVKLISQFSGNAIDDALAYAMNNKVQHIFGKAAHNLQPLVSKLGGHENTFRAVLNAANGKLPSSGIFKDIIVNVGGYDVYLRGSVINGVPKLGTMFIK